MLSQSGPAFPMKQAGRLRPLPMHGRPALAPSVIGGNTPQAAETRYREGDRDEHIDQLASEQTEYFTARNEPTFPPGMASL